MALLGELVIGRGVALLGEQVTGGGALLGE